MPRKRPFAWTTKIPKKEGWYWYRDADRSAVLHVFDPLGNGYWKAWDWHQGRLMLCAIEPYPGGVVWTTGSPEMNEAPGYESRGSRAE